jgi:hypothetical protein
MKTLLRFSRVLHLYLGVFATPALIFFALTGFLQTFSFHETTRGSDYKPPKLFVELGQLHKKQTLVVPEKKSLAPAVPAPSIARIKPDGASDKAAQPQAAEAKKKNLWPMKIFFAIISFALLLSTFTGLFMAYKYIRNKTLVTAALLSGIVIPVLLTLL